MSIARRLSLGLCVMLLAGGCIAAPVAAGTSVVDSSVTSGVSIPAQPASTADIDAKIANAIQAQQSQIQSQSNGIGLLALLVTIGSGAFAIIALRVDKLIAKRVSDLIDNRLYSLLNKEIDKENLRAARLNSILYAGMSEISKDMTYAAKKKFVAYAQRQKLDLTNPGQVGELIENLSAIFSTPTFIYSTLHQLAATDRTSRHTKEKVYVLYGEVKAGSITLSTMKQVVAALIEILENNQMGSPAIAHLEAFARLLKDARKPADLPDDPGF